MARRAKAIPGKHEGNRQGNTGTPRLEGELGVISKSTKPLPAGHHITCRPLLELAKCYSLLETQRVTLLTLWHLDCPRTEPAEDIRQDVILDFVLGKPRQYWEQAEEGELEPGS